ncbi:uncharacterized protein LOC143175014 [Nomia melanderi]|uniref:uncharacterized protein LOC143175014 n=1 Tax=Nomia melanderi TaxID=2448451 RepID=UPI003FCD7647
MEAGAPTNDGRNVSAMTFAEHRSDCHDHLFQRRSLQPRGDMVGQLRVPPRLVARLRRVEDVPKFDLFTAKRIRKNWSVIPLLMIEACVLVSIPLIALHRMFVTTIDVKLGGRSRYEIPSIPRFYDLRNPRSLKLMQLQELKPAIHLDNRYRLMRKEPMLDANGCETDTIGEDETAPPDLKEAFEQRLKCGRPCHSPKTK